MVEFLDVEEEIQTSRNRKKAYDKKLNLICRMAGNIFSGNYEEATPIQCVVHAMDIYNDAEELLKKELQNEAN